MATKSTTQVSDRESDTGDTYQAIPDEFAGFVANPTALKRGGEAVQTARDKSVAGYCGGWLRWRAIASGALSSWLARASDAFLASFILVQYTRFGA